MVAAETTDPGLVITAAIFGGAGAFLGALLGQVVGWIREHLAEKRVDRRREGDAAAVVERERRERRYTEYMEIQSVLETARVPARHLAFIAMILSHRDTNDTNPKVQEVVETALEQIKSLLTDNLTQATARAHVVGSQRRRAAMTELQSNCVIYGTSPINNVNRTVVDGGPEEWARRTQAGENVDLDDFTVESTISWTGVGQSLGDTASRTVDSIEPIQQMIREELKLD